MKNQKRKQAIQIVDRMMVCPICKGLVKNVNIHFQRSSNCGNKIDLFEFSNNFDIYKKEADRRRKRRNDSDQKMLIQINTRKQKIPEGKDFLKKIQIILPKP